MPNITQPTAAIVPVKSAFWSKINWAAGIGLLAALLSIWNIDLSSDLQTTIVQVLTDITQVIVPAVIIIFRTKFTTTVTAGSMTAAPTVNQAQPVSAVTPPGAVVNTTGA